MRLCNLSIRTNKIKGVFRVTGLKILGWVGKYIEKKSGFFQTFMHFERQNAFQHA